MLDFGLKIGLPLSFLIIYYSGLFVQDLVYSTIMIPILSKGIKEFYFSTSTSSNKIRHYKKDNKAGVTFFNGGNSVTLIGKMEIVNDKTIKEKLWQDFLIKHFTNGVNDSEYCLLKFISQEATIYIENQFETIAI